MSMPRRRSRSRAGAFARRGAGHGADADRRVGARDRPPPQRHPAHARERRGDRGLGARGRAARLGGAVHARALRPRGEGCAGEKRRMSTIRVNGAERALEAATVAELLAAIGVAAGARGVAVARNGAVVRTADWGTTALAPGDAIEIIR